jgi:tetratricopeptide (TPR) repeat protein
VKCVHKQSRAVVSKRTCPPRWVGAAALGLLLLGPAAGEATAQESAQPVCAGSTTSQIVDRCLQVINETANPVTKSSAYEINCKSRGASDFSPTAEAYCDKAVLENFASVSAHLTRALFSVEALQYSGLAAAASRDDFKARHVKRARSELDYVIANDPRNALALGRRARLAHWYKTDLAAALVDAQKAAELEPNAPGWHSLRGDLLTALGNVDDALLAYLEALKFSPNNDYVLTAAAKLYAVKKDWRNALALSSKPIDAKRPSIQNMLVNRGAIYAQMGDVENAKRDFVASLSSWAGNSEAWSRLGDLVGKTLSQVDCQNLNGVPKDAIKACTELLDFVPEEVFFGARASAYLANGQPDEAILDYTRMLERTRRPELKMVRLFERALAYRAAAHFEMSLVDVDASIAYLTCPIDSSRIDNACSERLVLRADILERLGRHDDAIALLSRLAAIKFADLRVFQQRAEINNNLGRLDAAMDDCNLALERWPDSPDARALRGSILVKKGDRANGIAELRWAAATKRTCASQTAHCIEPYEELKRLGEVSGAP